MIVLYMHIYAMCTLVPCARTVAKNVHLYSPGFWTIGKRRTHIYWCETRPLPPGCDHTKSTNTCQFILSILVHFECCEKLGESMEQALGV